MKFQLILQESMVFHKGLFLRPLLFIVDIEDVTNAIKIQLFADGALIYYSTQNSVEEIIDFTKRGDRTGLLEFFY